MSADMRKEEMDMYLKELSREYRKLNRDIPAEIIVVGGSAIVLQYGFRDQSSDIDVFYQGSPVIKEAAHQVALKYGLRDDWFNNDFLFIAKCNKNKLREHSKYYKSFGNVTVRILKPEYIIALKMLAAREFRNDISDIIGILASESINYTDIEKAINELFDNPSIDENIISEVKEYCEKDLTGLYDERVAIEQDNFQKILKYSKEHPGQVNRDNAGDILNGLNIAEKITSLLNMANELDSWIVSHPFNPEARIKNEESNNLVNEAGELIHSIDNELIKSVILKNVPERMLHIVEKPFDRDHDEIGDF